MMAQTKLYKFGKGNDDEINQVIRKEIVNSVTTKLCIPLNAGNKDYQEYLEWVEAGNTAEAAD